MNRIKDFFYDKNDIFVALIILAFAAFVIYIRIDTIMAYPETLVEASDTAQTSASESTTASAAAASPSGSSSEPAGSLVSSTSLTISDTSPAAVASQLESAGYVSSADDFKLLLKKHKLSDKIQSGTFDIPDQATDRQIMVIITGVILD